MGEQQEIKEYGGKYISEILPSNMEGELGRRGGDGVGIISGVMREQSTISCARWNGQGALGIVSANETYNTKIDCRRHQRRKNATDKGRNKLMKT
jgi:hypothetical protein